MAQHRRLEEPHRFYLLSNRTHRGEFLLRPDRECNRILKGCLAREAARKEIRLVAYAFLSNHFHLVAAFPNGNRAAFMRDFQREISRRLTTHRGCEGGMFPRPYHPQALLGAEPLLDKISYTANNPVRHGLVPHARAWPGVTSAEKLREETPLVGRWLDHTTWHNLKRRQDSPPRSAAMVEYAVDLHIPTCIPGETESQRRHTICEAIEQGRQAFCQGQGGARYRRAGPPSRYRKVDWRTQKPIDENWCEIRKTCAGADADGVANYLERRRTIDERYEQAARQWKQGKAATFPTGTYPPGQAKPVEQRAPRAPPG